MSEDISMSEDIQAYTVNSVAVAVARRLQATSVELEHLAWSFLLTDSNAKQLLVDAGADLLRAADELAKLEIAAQADNRELPPNETRPAPVIVPSPALLILRIVARDKARSLKHRQVGPLHILHGLMTTMQPNQPAQMCFESAGIDIAHLFRLTGIALKLQMQGQAVPGFKTSHRHKPSRASFWDWFSDDAKTTLSLAKERASHFDRSSVFAEDLLHVIAQRQESGACSTLARHVNVEHLRSELNALSSVAPPSSESFFSASAMMALKCAQEKARSLGNEIDSAHILIGLIETAQSTELAGLNQFIDHAKIKTLILELSTPDFEPQAHLVASERNLKLERAIETGANKIYQSDRMERMLLRARVEAAICHQEIVQPEHLATACIREARRSEGNFVSNRELDFDLIITTLEDSALTKYESIAKDSELRLSRFSDDSIRYLTIASGAALGLGSRVIDLNHLAIALLCDERTKFGSILKMHNLAPTAVRRRLELCWFKQAVITPRGSPLVLTDLAAAVELKELLPEEGFSEVKAEQLVRTRSPGQLSPRSKRLIQDIKDAAGISRAHTIGIEELFLGILNAGGIAATVMLNYGLRLEPTRELLDSINRRGARRRAPNASPIVSSHVELIVEKALLWCKAHGRRIIEPEHILLVILQESEGVAATLCEVLNLEVDYLIEELTRSLENS